MYFGLTLPTYEAKCNYLLCTGSARLCPAWRTTLDLTEVSIKIETTFDNGSLGSRNDEERSEMRYVMWIAFRESSNLWTHIALLWSMPVWESLVIILATFLFVRYGRKRYEESLWTTLNCSTYSIRKSQVKKGCLERDCCSGTRCLTLGTTSSDVCERNFVSHNAEMFGRDWLVLSSAVLIPKKGRKPLEPWSQIR